MSLGYGCQLKASGIYYVLDPRFNVIQNIIYRLKDNEIIISCSSLKRLKLNIMTCLKVEFEQNCCVSQHLF